MQSTLYDNTGCSGSQVSQWTETLAGVNIAAGGGTQVFTITNHVITTNLCDDSTNCQVSIHIEADYGDTICECDGTDNTYCADNKSVDIPDLTVTDIDFSAVGCSTDGLSGTVGVTIQNDGCGTATSIPVALTCDGGPTFVNQTVASLAGSGTSTTVSFAISGNWSDCTDCSHQFTATVDPGNTIYECDGTDNDRTETYTSTLPDIEVSADTLAVAPSDDGEATVSGTITLTNNGCGSNLTTNVPVQFTLYDNTGCSGSQVSQWTETLAGVNIAAGGGTQVFTITNHVITTNLCDDSTNCQVSIHIEADYGDTICECDGTDNVYCADNKNVDIPDIEVAGDTLTVTPSADSRVTVSGTVTLRNAGCGSNLTANVPVRFTLFDNIGCSGTIVAQWMETLTGVDIAAGGGTQAFTITNHVITTNLCDNSTDCQVSIHIEADYGDVICECDGTDNTYCDNNKPVSIPDLQVNSVTPSVSCIGDGNLRGEVVVNVSNVGCAGATNAVVRLASTCGIAFVDQTVDLTAGSDADVTFTFTPSCGTCTCTFTASIDPANAIFECDGGNNSLVSAAYTPTIPDLEVTADTLGVSCSADGAVTVSGTITLTNAGCGSNLTADVPVQFTLYGNTDCSGGVFVDQWTETLTGVNIAAGGGTQAFTISNRIITANLCDDSTGCQVSIHIEADYGDVICECDGTDNTYCANNKPVSIPDIEVCTAIFAVAASGDGKVTVAGMIMLANVGCGANLMADVPVRFTLYENTGCSGIVIDQWTETLADVNIPFGSGTQVFTVTHRTITTNLCENSPGCQVSIRVEADYDDAICECDGSNNVRCVDPIDVHIPDLEVSDDALVVTCTQTGVTVSGTVTLANAGCGSSLTAAVPMRFALYDDTGCSGNVLDQWMETLIVVDVAAAGGTQVVGITPRGVVCELCACPNVSVRIEADPFDAIWECDGTDNDRCDDKTTIDTGNPVIHDLRVDQHVLVDDCCEAIITFDGYVEDNCCISSDGITITVTNPTANATVEFTSANVIFTNMEKYRVDFVGEIHVSCLTSCPANIVVAVNATDSCGNSADTVVSVPDPANPNYNGGDIYDKTAPEPKDDPNGDEDRSASDDLEVRVDGNGQHRLMVRENTPVRIDVVYNDDDNCSYCTCCGTMWIHDIVDLPEYGTVMIEVDHGDCDGGSVIRYAPYHGYYGKDEFTYRIVDACGNVSQEATVYIEVVAQMAMDDIYLTTCVGAAVSFDVTATDLWVEPDNPGEIPFVFSIFTPPMHGVISGDLGDITYEIHGATTKEIESATIALVYTPAAGFTGRDALTLRFADPFGGSSTAVVDIAVIECAGQPGVPPLFVLQQGEIFPLIVPLTFASVYETAWDTVTLIAELDGVAYQGVLSATWEKSIGRYVLRLNTTALPPGTYRMTIPLGNGETVTLMIEVSEAT